MPVYQFEAMDTQGQEIKDVIEATDEEEALATIRQMGYYLTADLKEKKQRKKKDAATSSSGKKKTFAIGRVKGKILTTFTRQLSTLQDAGLPILRSLEILEGQAKPGQLKNALIDVIDEINSGASLSEGMQKAPKAFDRLYINMVRAGEAGGALEIVLRRLAEFQEKAQSLKRKVKGAMVYPTVVILVAVAILTFIMIYIIPKFTVIFDQFGTELPVITEYLIWISNLTVEYWYLIPGIPISIWLWVKMWCRFKFGKYGWDLFVLHLPVAGAIAEKAVVARTSRTLGTLVSSGVPILEALNIAKETSGNAVFEKMYAKVQESVREGESINEPMRKASKPGFNAMTAFFYLQFPPLVGLLIYALKWNRRIVDDIVVNMVDVGEETGELDKMLYKVADVYDEEVDIAVESLVSLLEPLMVVVLGFIVGFIVIALFMPLIKLLQDIK
ncbi:Type IV fimbrial assembly protein PilC [Planctomycetales bacterium 10988]|nr:Type IV fimbrial assembly protein PilC [Planctomycetales bacterium 10988]